MSVSPAGSSFSVHHAATGRLEFHLRIPAVTGDEAASRAALQPPVELKPNSSLEFDEPGRDGLAPPRGMQILNRILDRRPRSGWRRFAGGPSRNRLWIAAIAIIALACLLLMIGVAIDREEEIESDTGSALAAEEFDDAETETTLSPPNDVFRQPHGQLAQIESADEARGDAGVRTVSFDSKPSAPARGAWLEGTIVPEEDVSPRGSRSN